jgi:tetratricopeptide (TPR) repeat protein
LLRASSKTLADFRQALRLDPKDPNSCNSLARLLATCPKADVRDGKKAVEYARKACELTGWKEAVYLDTLASAYAESGDFKQAVKWQKKALESSEKFPEKERDEMRARLKLYEQGKPYREK